MRNAKLVGKIDRMAEIVLATFGSLGDLHPLVALGLELKRRGHLIRFATMDFYREKIESLGFEYARMAPHLSPDDIEKMPELVDARKGTEKILREMIIGNVPEMYDDLLAAAQGADILVSGEIIYAAKSVVEKTGIKWVTTTLAPISLFSTYDPPVPPTAMWFENLRFLGSGFHGLLFRVIRMSMHNWLDEYRVFRLKIGLDPHDDPIFRDKFLARSAFNNVLAGVGCTSTGLAYGCCTDRILFLRRAIGFGADAGCSGRVS